MLSAILKLLILLLVVRMLYAAFRAIGNLLGISSSVRKDGNRKPRRRDKKDYSDLTSYEIEDADFEELKDKK